MNSETIKSVTVIRDLGVPLNVQADVEQQAATSWCLALVHNSGRRESYTARVGPGQRAGTISDLSRRRTAHLLIVRFFS